jgi:hypothetical protein
MSAELHPSQIQEVNFRDRLQDYVADTRARVGRIAASGLLVIAGATTAYSADSLTDPAMAEAAACSGTHCDAQGTTELSGGDWLGGGGVDIYANNGSAAYDSGVNEYVTTPSNTSVKSGEEWQCVELVNRLYLSKGWISSTWIGNGNTLKDNLPTGLTYEPNGSITSIKPGDAITLDDGGYGHAAIINSYNTATGSVDIVNQNTAEVHSSATLSNKTLTMSGWAGYSVQGIIEAPDATTTTTTTPTGPNFMPAMIQRPSGETDVAVVGPANSLMFYYNFAGNGTWHPVTVPNGQAYSTPAIVQRSSGETDIAVQGPNNSMDFYYNAQGSPNWGISHVAVPGWAFSAPAVAQRPSGETDIAVQGPNNELDFYMNAPGSPLWSEMTIAGGGTAYSTPAIIQRPSGETDVVVQGPSNSMDFYYNQAGDPSWHVSHVAVPGWAYSAPAVVQRPSGESDIAVQGPNNELDLYINTQGSPLWGKVTAAGTGGTYGAPNPPVMLQRPSGETDIAVQGAGNQADLYYNAQGSQTWSESIAAVGGYALRQPAMVQRSNTGETDLAVTGPNNRLDFYLNAQGQPLWGYVPITGNNSAS